MPPDTFRTDEAASWLHKAETDLRAARVDLDADPPLVEDAMYHCQQATEKAEKAFLVWKDVPFRKVHDLAELGAQCVQADSTLADICRRAESLSVFAVAFRYPGGYESPSAQEGEETVKLAREVHDAVAARLPAHDAGGSLNWRQTGPAAPQSE